MHFYPLESIEESAEEWRDFSDSWDSVSLFPGKVKENDSIFHTLSLLKPWSLYCEDDYLWRKKGKLDDFDK